MYFGFVGNIFIHTEATERLTVFFGVTNSDIYFANLNFRKENVFDKIVYKIQNCLRDRKTDGNTLCQDFCLSADTAERKAL